MLVGVGWLIKSRSSTPHSLELTQPSGSNSIGDLSDTFTPCLLAPPLQSFYKWTSNPLSLFICPNHFSRPRLTTVLLHRTCGTNLVAVLLQQRNQFKFLLLLLLLLILHLILLSSHIVHGAMDSYLCSENRCYI